MASPELSMVIPAFNEGAHLSSVIEEMATVLDGFGIDYELCIVNNGSVDDTAAVIDRLEKVNPRITHVYLAQNRQYGGGVRAGLECAKGDMLGWVHADGQADPHDIIAIYTKMSAQHRELGKAVRMQSSESQFRKTLSFFFKSIFRILFLSPYRDVNATPKLLTRAAMQKLALSSDDWFLDPEFVIKGIRFGLPISEVETTWRLRKSGATKARLILHSLQFLKNMLVYRFGIK
jgi:glycosyltransferase involved in cell wall biosynthesis